MRQLFLKIFSVSGILFQISCTEKIPHESITKGNGHHEEGSQSPIHKEIWTCSMHPQIQLDHPGSCPICGMKLVLQPTTLKEPVENESSVPEGHASILVDPQMQRLIGMRTEIIEKKKIERTIVAAGRVAFDPELYTAQNEYLEAIQQQERVRGSSLDDVRHSAHKMVDSARMRLKVLGLSDDQITQLRSTGASISSLILPKEGEKIWVYAEVFEMDLRDVRPGLEVVASGRSLGEGTIKGKVVSIDSVINAETRTAKVRIQMPNKGNILRPESYLDIAIKIPMGEQLAIPFDAILNSGMEAWVFVMKEDKRFEARKVGIRFYSEEDAIIDSGLEVGERIVTSANFLIDSESRIRHAIGAK